MNLQKSERIKAQEKQMLNKIKQMVGNIIDTIQYPVELEGKKLIEIEIKITAKKFKHELKDIQKRKVIRETLIEKYREQATWRTKLKKETIKKQEIEQILEKISK